MFGYRRQVDGRASLPPKLKIVEDYAAQMQRDAASGDAIFPASCLSHHKLVIQQAIIDLIRSKSGGPNAVEDLVRLLLSTIRYSADVEVNDPGVVAAIEKYGVAGEEYRAAMARAHAMEDELDRLLSELGELGLGEIANYIIGRAQFNAAARRVSSREG